MYLYQYCQRRSDGSGYVTAMLHTNKLTESEFRQLILKYEAEIDWKEKIEKRIHKIQKKLMFFNGFKSADGVSTSDLEYGQYWETIT